MEQINGINVELLKGAMTELSNMVEKLGVNDKFDIDEFEKRLINYIDSPIGGGQ